MNNLDNFFIKNMSGTMCWRDIELFEFSIVNRELVHYVPFTREYVIWPFIDNQITYYNFNLFLRDRIKPENSMMIKEFLEAYCLTEYNPEEIVKRNNCNNRVDCYWVKYQNFGPQSYEEMRNIKEPYWKEGVLEDYYNPVYENIIISFEE